MKRRYIYRLLTTIGCIIAGITVAGSAHAFVFDMGAGSGIDTSGTNGALMLDIVQMNPNLENVIIDLAVGQTSDPIYFATVGTTESWINNDDRVPAEVTAAVDFDNPDITQSIGGTSVGFTALWHFFQSWNLEWENPVNVVTLSGIDFTVGLSNVDYVSWFWQGPDGTADIYATVTLNAVPVPVPLLLLGTGLIGLVSMRKKITAN